MSAFLSLVFGLLLGAVLGFAGGFRRLWLVLAAGPVLAAGFLVLTYLLAPTSDPGDCSDCGEFHGRWMDGVVLIVALINLVEYVVGVFVGAGLRRSRQERRA